MANAPTTLNGYEVIDSFHTPAASCTREGFVVLVDRGEDQPYDRFVTAWYGVGDKGWNTGHYWDARESAQADFAARCKKGF